MTALILLSLLVFAILAGAWYCCRETFFVDRRALTDPHTPMVGEQYEPFRGETYELVDAALKLPCEDVYTDSADGLRLHARFFKGTEGAPVELMAHGYRSMAYRDFCRELLAAHESGRNVLLIDQRAHGESEGKYLSFGINEKYDCLCWIRYLTDRLGAETKIILHGLSMGAGTVLMCAGLELPENVRGIVADAGYTSPEEIIRKVIRDRRLPQWPVFPLVCLGARIFAGFRLRSEGPREALKRCKVPVLLFHGDDDRFIPCEMSRVNQKACASPCKLICVRGAGHALCSYTDSELFIQSIDAFINSVCGDEESAPW